MLVDRPRFSFRLNGDRKWAGCTRGNDHWQSPDDQTGATRGRAYNLHRAMRNVSQLENEVWILTRYDNTEGLARSLNDQMIAIDISDGGRDRAETEPSLGCET